MSPRDLRHRLNDIIVAVDSIRSYERRLDNAGIGRDDPIRLDAVVRQLAIIGEAASHLTDDAKAQAPDIPWSDVVGMRVILDHRYHLVDPNAIWDTVDSDLGPIRKAAKRIRSATAAQGRPRAAAGHEHTCGGPTADGGTCQRKVSGPGVRCHQHR